MLVASKPCKHCGTLGHYPSQCWKNPKQLKSFSSFKTQLSRSSPLVAHKPMKKVGKQARLWMETRREWIAQHPGPTWKCYLCGVLLTRETLTLDHIQSRGRYPELRYVLSNLQPSCAPCNLAKGSRDLDELAA